MWKLKRPVICAAVLLLAGAGGLGGCAYYGQTPAVAQGGQTAQRVYTYANGRYEFHGDGTASRPYYWVWVAGSVSVAVPPPTPLPPQS